MTMTAQMAAIVSTISSLKEKLETELLALPDDSTELFDIETFANVLTGIQSFRRLPGISDHMGFAPNYHCSTKEEADELKEYLSSVFGISDAQSLTSQALEFFHIYDEFFDFASEWDGTPNFKPEDLDEESRTHYINSRDFAEQLRDLVGLNGFLAWDVGERLMLIRTSAACGVIDDDTCRRLMAAEVNAILAVFNNFADFAISALAGCVYFMFVSMGRSEEDGLAGFLDINLSIVERLFAEGIWPLNAWCERITKYLAIDEESLVQIIPDEMGQLFCVVTDRVLVEGFNISVMIREESVDSSDSGWRFFAGNEDDDYVENRSNFGTVDLNLASNYSQDIVPLLDSPVGSFIVREDDGVFRLQSNEAKDADGIVDEAIKEAQADIQDDEFVEDDADFGDVEEDTVELTPEDELGIGEFDPHALG